MTFLNRRGRRAGGVPLALAAAALAAVPAAAAARPAAAPAAAARPSATRPSATRPSAAQPSSPPVPKLSWQACPDAAGFQCTDATVPRDYNDASAGTFDLAVTRLPARDQKHRIGSLFVNFGGPGGPNVTTLQKNGQRLFATLNQRFDLVTFDPRGTGESTPAIDCAVDQETAGPFSQPFMTPFDVDQKKLLDTDRRYVQRCEQRNQGVLPYVSTANVARDLDQLRQAVGDRKLSYLGLSYGTFLGSTYASLFPHSYRTLALEGVLDPDQYANHPLTLRASLAAAQEREVGRFLQACAGNQPACSHFGGTDPGEALDALITRLDAKPLAVGGRTLDGDDVRVALGQGLHSKETWSATGAALAAAEAGNGAPLRQLADGFYGRKDAGSYQPYLDEFFAVSALDQRKSPGLQQYLTAGEQSWNEFDHSYFLAGYAESAWGNYPVQPRGVFRGPFRAAANAPTVLVIGTTYDPATPYKAAQSLTRQLGNARLLTMVGDGHGAYGGESPCIDNAVNSYLEQSKLPAEGTQCQQQVPFDPPAAH
jgi:pimeloyl-ACP methyl ester carboxylesterase